MRRLKSGEVKYKPSAVKEAARLAVEPLPMVVYRVGSKVKVYLGAGWAAGYVRHSTARCCGVMLAKEQRMVTCFDNRNLHLELST